MQAISTSQTVSFDMDAVSTLEERWVTFLLDGGNEITDGSASLADPTSAATTKAASMANCTASSKVDSLEQRKVSSSG